MDQDVKVVILAGGLGTRFAEETDTKPKPMIAIGGRPIIWHIMKIFSRYGFNDFIVCAGYKGHLIEEYFADYLRQLPDAPLERQQGRAIVGRSDAESWKVTVVDTGLDTMTGGRIRRVQPYLGNGDFLLTYGDGVANVDVGAVLALHRRAGRLATVTAVRPPARFGALNIKGNQVTEFVEKPLGDGGWINGGFFALQPGVFDRIPGDSTTLEYEVMSQLAAEGQLTAYCHSGFWQAMDTLRDQRQLEELWASGKAPWKVW